jgi:hypothetical protein
MPTLSRVLGVRQVRGCGFRRFRRADLGSQATFLVKTVPPRLNHRGFLMARRPELQPLIDHLRQQAQVRDDIRTECAGIVAGSWFATPVRRGEDLVAAGLLMLAGHVDLDQLDHWVRVGWERTRGASVPSRTARMTPNRAVRRPETRPGLMVRHGRPPSRTVLPCLSMVIYFLSRRGNV